MTTLDDQVRAMRAFNRFYTRQIGVLQEGLLQTPHSLSQARVIFELAQPTPRTASDLARDLSLDAGYLSRLLAGLEQDGLLDKVPDENDKRQRRLHLTEAGQAAYQMLDSRSSQEVAALLSTLHPDTRRELLGAMQQIERILSPAGQEGPPFILRPHEPGDIGWVIQRHGALYAQEYGWDNRFEALVAEIGAGFIRDFKPGREHCWIAEREGQRVGSVFVVEASPDVAKLRLLLVEPQARGLGLGTSLVRECIRFAQRAGYAKMTLWTNSILVEARHIYDKCGFSLINSEPYQDFGQDLVSETWELAL